MKRLISTPDNLLSRIRPGYIDLSKRRVSPEDVIKCEERYNKSKTVHTIVRHVAEKTGKEMDEIMDLVAWPLYKKYGHAFEAFKLSIRCAGVCSYNACLSYWLIAARSCRHSEPETVFADMNIPEDVYNELRVNIARRLTPQPVKVRADIEVTNFSYNGILTIQEALAAGESLSTEEVPIKIRLVAPPLYVMTTNTTDKQGAIERLEQAIEKIGEVIKGEDGGFLNVKMKPKAVSETDDLELAALMDRVARENKEVSGESPLCSAHACVCFLLSRLSTYGWRSYRRRGLGRRVGGSSLSVPLSLRRLPPLHLASARSCFTSPRVVQSFSQCTLRAEYRPSPAPQRFSDAVSRENGAPSLRLRIVSFPETFLVC